MKKESVKANGKAYVTLKVTLEGTDISRTIVVPASMNLHTLHFVLQELFGWLGGHLWDFEVSRNERYGIPGDWQGGWGDDEIKDCGKFTIGTVLPVRGSRMFYVYDMGDGWTHKITRMADPKVSETCVTKTSGLMGIDDIGGPWGLNGFVEQLKAYDADPKAKVDEDFKDLLEWSGFEDDEARKEYLTAPTLEELTAVLREISR